MRLDRLANQAGARRLRAARRATAPHRIRTFFSHSKQFSTPHQLDEVALTVASNGEAPSGKLPLSLLTEEVSAKMGVARAERLPVFAGLAVLMVAVVVCLGWLLDIPLIKTLFVSHVTMKANTAAGLGLSSIALLLLYGPERSWTTTVARLAGSGVGMPSACIGSGEIRATRSGRSPLD